MFTALF